MGLIAKVLSFTRRVKGAANVSDVKIDQGAGANITAEHFSAPGDDSYPLDTDYAVMVGIPRTGGGALVGYVDPVNTPQANKGDKRIYGRDSSSGIAVVQAWLKNDGSAIISNALGTFELLANGNIKLNGVIIDPAGNITVPGDITAAAGTMSASNIAATTSLKAVTKEIAGHGHSQANDSGGNVESNTGPNN